MSIEDRLVDAAGLDAERTDPAGADAGLAVVTGISAEPLDTAALVDRVRRADCGGIVVFEGTVRSPNQGHDVQALEYEVWEGRAEQQLDLIARQVAERHGLRGVLAVHRSGGLGVGEPAVVVAAVSVHRDAAFHAASELIDRIKSEAWIWKKELWADGERWVEGC